MKRLIMIALTTLFLAGCHGLSSVKLTHKCNGDKICRCDASCEKSCKDCKCN